MAAAGTTTCISLAECPELGAQVESGGRDSTRANERTPANERQRTLNATAEIGLLFMLWGVEWQPAAYWISCSAAPIIAAAEPPPPIFGVEPPSRRRPFGPAVLVGARTEFIRSAANRTEQNREEGVGWLAGERGCRTRPPDSRTSGWWAAACATRSKPGRSRRWLFARPTQLNSTRLGSAKLD